MSQEKGCDEASGREVQVSGVLVMAFCMQPFLMMLLLCFQVHLKMSPT